jgi:hypothetical protein
MSPHHHTFPAILFLPEAEPPGHFEPNVSNIVRAQGTENKHLWRVQTIPRIWNTHHVQSKNWSY